MRESLGLLARTVVLHWGAGAAACCGCGTRFPQIVLRHLEPTRRCRSQSRTVSWRHAPRVNLRAVRFELSTEVVRQAMRASIAQQSFEDNLALRGLQQKLDLDSVEREFDLPPWRSTEHTSIEQRHDVAVNGLHITVHSTGCLAY